MKCDNLKAFNCVESDVQDFCEPRLVYSKSEVDAAIAELKRENERLVKCCKEYDSRQRIDERIKFNGSRQLRATKRALWLARATALNRIDVGEYLRKHMNSKFWNDGFHTFQEACYVMQNVINNAENACRAKAEEYK